MNREEEIRATGLWHHYDFLKLWSGQTISLLGTQITLVALPLTAVLVLKAGAFQMGILTAVETAPFLLFGLFAGVLVDRMPRRPLLIWMDVGRALLLASIPIFALLGLLNMLQLYVVGFLVMACTTFFEIAYMSFLPVLVTRDFLIEGNSKLEASRSVTHILGPAAAGVLVQILTAPVAIGIDALSYVVSVATLWIIRTPEPMLRPHAQQDSSWQEIKEGLSVVMRAPLLRVMAILTGIANIADSMLLTIVVLYITRDLHVTPVFLGVIFAAIGPGELLGSLLTPHLVRRFGMGPALVGAASLMAVASLLIPLAGGSQYVVVLILGGAYFLIGIGNPIYNINSMSLRQAITPDRLLGRINATMWVISWGAIPIGALVAGALGSVIGLRLTLVIGAVGYVLWGVLLFLSPIRSLREPPTLVEEELALEGT
jgi:MFS family permease